MRAGRAKFTQVIFLKAERGLRAAALEVARESGMSLSELVRRQLRQAVAARASTPVRPTC